MNVFDMLALPQRNGRDVGQLLTYLFRGMDERARSVPDLPAWIDQMDRNHVGGAMLSISADEDRDWVRTALESHPGRFAAGLVVDPREGIAAVRRIDDYVRNVGVSVLRLGPWRVGKPPTDRIYWPIYVKAIELGVPVQINVGIPGPKTPAWVQDPIYVDEVCYEFPELVVAMSHVGFPWTGTVLRNLLRWDNCYLMLNSYAPRRWPDDIIEHLRTNVRHKMMYATEFPLMGWDRTLSEIEQLQLPDASLQALLTGNAKRFLGQAWPEVPVTRGA